MKLRIKFKNIKAIQAALRIWNEYFDVNNINFTLESFSSPLIGHRLKCYIYVNFCMFFIVYNMYPLLASFINPSVQFVYIQCYTVFFFIVFWQLLNSNIFEIHLINSFFFYWDYKLNLSILRQYFEGLSNITKMWNKYFDVNKINLVRLYHKSVFSCLILVINFNAVKIILYLCKSLYVFFMAYMFPLLASLANPSIQMIWIYCLTFFFLKWKNFTFQYFLDLFDQPILFFSLDLRDEIYSTETPLLRFEQYYKLGKNILI